MLKNNDWWIALDNICKKYKITLARLARMCGLSSSTLNKSKRYNKYGKAKWLNTGTLTKILNTLNMTLDDFCKYLPQHND